MDDGTARRHEAIRLIAGTFTIVFVAARLLRMGLPVGRYVVDGPSMEPAYRAGDRVLVNRLAYVRRAPAPGDVVVLRDPERRARHLIKRIVMQPEGAAAGRDRYFVLGDNAAVSRDSRVFGPVWRRDIVGKAWRKY
jgi:nickel-type superoxide dismutase maturation protease